MEEIITKDNLNTYTLGLKSVLSSMGEAILNNSTLNSIDGKCDQILTAVSSDDVQGSKITINLVSEGLNISYVLATSGSKVLGQLQNGDSVVVPFGAEYELTPHLSNGTDKFPTSGVATKMEETVTVYGSGYSRVDLGLPSGNLWADRNAGAMNIEDCGWCFLRGSIIKYYSRNASRPTMNSDNPAYEYKDAWSSNIDPCTQHMSSSWRTPTITDINELISNCAISVQFFNGVRGFHITGRNGNSIFMPIVPSSSDFSTYGGYLTSSITSNYSGNRTWYYLRMMDGFSNLNNANMLSLQNTTPDYYGLLPVRAVMTIS